MSNYVQKPKKVYCGPIPYSISFEDMSKIQKQNNEDTIDFGCADHALQKIVIDNKSGPEVQKETLMHEILHCCMALSGIAYRIGRIDLELEEDIIQCISPFLFNVLSNPDNVQILKYLFNTK